MNRTSRLTVLGLVLGAATTWAIVVRAGNINPPAGAAVAPTMNSLADIYALAQQPAAPPPYVARHIAPLMQFVTEFIDNGGGFLHSIIVTTTALQLQSIDISDGGVIIATVQASSQANGGTQVFLLDVTYQSTLQIMATTNPGSSSVTVSYLP